MLRGLITVLGDELKKVSSITTNQKAFQKELHMVYDIIVTVYQTIQHLMKTVSEISNILAHLEGLIISISQEETKILGRILREIQELKKMVESTSL